MRSKNAIAVLEMSKPLTGDLAESPEAELEKTFMKNSLIHSLDPISNNQSSILILGSMLGKTSWENKKYYEFGDNCFWEFIFAITKRKPARDYEKKKTTLIENKIAIWDVLKYCERDTSLDSKIINEVPNDFNSFFNDHKNIRVIFFNGTTARRFYKKYIGFTSDYMYFLLPSTSSTPGKYVKQKTERLKTWLEIQKYV